MCGESVTIRHLIETVTPHAFPSDVAGRLSAACGYCGRGVIDGYGIIYDKKTAVILDIVQLAGDILR